MNSNSSGNQKPSRDNIISSEAFQEIYRKEKHDAEIFLARRNLDNIPSSVPPSFGSPPSKTKKVPQSPSLPIIDLGHVASKPVYSEIYSPQGGYQDHDSSMGACQTTQYAPKSNIISLGGKKDAGSALSPKEKQRILDIDTGRATSHIPEDWDTEVGRPTPPIHLPPNNT